MRLAVVAQQASAGGGTRFLRPLVKALANEYPDLTIRVFLNSYTADQLGASAGLEGDRISVSKILPELCALPGSILNGHPPISPARGLLALRPRGRSNPHGAAADLARRLSRFDAVYLAWPYFLHPIRISVPVVGTFHDFNYKHDLGTLGREFVDLLEIQAGYWLGASSIAVASSQFIGEEMRQFYGAQVKEMAVVRLSTLLAGAPRDVHHDIALARHGLKRPYVICPSNTSRHKNLERLLRAYSVIRKSGGPPLVLIGNGTQLLHGLSRGQENDPAAVSLFQTFLNTGLKLNHDVFAFGYVSDEDADGLIGGAQMLVAPSLYEAGSGPALDAWALGTPVAMSSIPPFVEHESFLGVKAALFDPYSEASIAETILHVLGNSCGAADMAEQSRQAMTKYTWRDVARGYRSVFDAAVQGSVPAAPWRF